MRKTKIKLQTRSQKSWGHSTGSAKNYLGDLGEVTTPVCFSNQSLVLICPLYPAVQVSMSKDMTRIRQESL
jgi:hypothetical protein